ncbi:MAG: HisA/HisF-related TIM barrel protein [Methylococcales bacterium]|nr:HisA/HisF-related TIM barrel protein [Methylococcales bacterium]
MQIIPVIDLKDGLVVHAVRGDRQHYRPIHLESALTRRSDIDSVMAAFLRFHAFQTFYIADLNAICGDGDHTGLIRELLAAYPHLDFWIDNGSRLADLDTPRPKNHTAVIGTESQPRAGGSRHDYILSLDYKLEQASGDPAWFSDAGLWPERVIVMTLSRIGSHAGPDFEKLRALSGRHPGKQFVAAGGIRHAEDLSKLADMGIHAALLATALHRGLICAADI